MVLRKVICTVLCIVLVDAYVVTTNFDKFENASEIYDGSDYEIDKQVANKIDDDNDLANSLNGVYSECLLYISYTCIQKKTLLYLQKLNNLREVAVLGDYVKFVKANQTNENDENFINLTNSESSSKLAEMIDNAIDRFFDNHVLRFKALGKDVLVPRSVEEFVGRKKKGGGGGGGGGGHGHEDTKKKMMMMAMMCMKMKFMMVVPAMMGMMGMMSLKGMMFSMMSFMMTKMMLLMKILEKKGSFGGGGGGGDGGWAAGGGGGGGGAWMPAGGPDYGGGGGGGGGYDANGQWQSRSIPETVPEQIQATQEELPLISYVTPTIRFNHIAKQKKSIKNINDELIKMNAYEQESEDTNAIKSRKKRGIVDVLHNAYIYWLNKILGNSLIYKPQTTVYPKYKIINGVKYVYSPVRTVPKVKVPKAIKPVINTPAPTNDELKPLVVVEDFNKGEIMDSPVEARFTKEKFHQMKTTVNDVIDANPWQ